MVRRLRVLATALLLSSVLQPAWPVASRYETDYPTIPYDAHAADNPIARLQAQLDRGEVSLDYKSPRGYLDSLLAALKIDPSSQTLVYSKTSLQIDAINAATPRAIYFNDDTYVAWVQGGGMLEVVTMDAKLGAVFYTLPNHRAQQLRLSRETSRCLTCHDTFSMLGGGVPQFRFTSTQVSVNGAGLLEQPGVETTDDTPLSERWGGWFVSGQVGPQPHLGNILVRNTKELSALDPAKRQQSYDSLDELLDVRPYVTNKSDVVALLVLEHQAFIHNLITRANFKSRTLLTKTEHSHNVEELTYSALSPVSQTALQRLLEPMVHSMLFINAASLKGGIASTSGFDRWFQAQAPRDRQGRSLRELDLNTRVFKYRLSYLIYSPGFDALPGCVKEFIYTRLGDILSGRDHSSEFAVLPAQERADINQILADTKPAYATFVSTKP